MTRSGSRAAVGFIVLTGLMCFSGCAAIMFPIKGTPACTLPAECRAESKRNLVAIDVTQLTQPQPDVYRLGPGDVISVYVPGVIPYQEVDSPPTLPPINIPLPGSDFMPSVGLPVVVAASGNISVSNLRPFSVEGMTLEEAAAAITKEYADREIIRDEFTSAIVGIMRPRTTTVTVVREDTGSSTLSLNDQSAMGSSIQLPAYRNDVLNALMATGGLPGLLAKNEVWIYRNGHRSSGALPDYNGNGVIIGSVEYEMIDALPGTLAYAHDIPVDGPEVVIPLRVQAGTQIQLRPEDVVLNAGDVVYVSNRATEVFYTAGLLSGGSHMLPRDYDIDIFEAMAIAGYSYGNAGGGGGGGRLIPSSGIVPTQLFIFRERQDGSEYTIKIDLSDAITDDCERLLVKPGDKLFLRHSPGEEVLNFGIFSFFTFGLRQLFTNN